ncbi:MAG: glutaminase, partial [Saprospiraceae bacterium]
MNFYYEQILNEIYQDVQLLKDDGEVASYIPELASIIPSKFGVHLCTIENEHYGVGDHEEKFSIQSIGKVLTLALAFQQKGEDLWDRV